VTTRPEPLLLDTHVWLWLVRGEDRLPHDVLEPIFAAAGARSLFLSAISPWEIGLLDAKRRISLNRPCLDWLREAVEHSGVQIAPLTLEIAVESHRLPELLHDDLVDRILIATARLEALTLVTLDRAILDYAVQGHLRALPC
jgi:PIN domain nuclease of toxin-antitoxin system